MQDDWKDFVEDTNINFFDTNKLYVKSLVDYKTRNYPGTKREVPRLPNITSKSNSKQTTKRNSVNRVQKHET